MHNNRCAIYTPFETMELRHFACTKGLNSWVLTANSQVYALYM
jgi:hypothetical protein